MSRIYEDLGSRVVLERMEYEVTAPSTAMAVALTVAAAATSFGRSFQQGTWACGLL